MTMRALVRALLVAMTLFAARHAFAQQPASVNVRLEGEQVIVDVTVRVAARHGIVWAVLTDYEHMAAFVSNLKSSKVLSRKGNRLEVEQEGQAKRGPLTFAFSTIRAVELLAEREIRSTLVRGDFKSYAFTTRISPTSEGLTEIVHHGEYVPNRWVPPVIGPAMIETETRKQYDELIAEMVRRQAAEKEPLR